MIMAFETTPGALKYRLMAALEAAQVNGGDRRGMMSAAMLIVRNGIRENDGKVLELESNMNFSPLKDIRNQLESNESFKKESNSRIIRPK
jgi:uncharacterized Ntn-hydrolase superfamily protein